MIKTSHKIKTVIVAITIFCGYLFLFLRLIYLQIYKHEFYQNKAFSQHTIKMLLPPKRGKILDRNHRNLAISVAVPSVYGVPYKVENIDLTARKLARILDIKKKYIKKQLSKKNKFVWIKRKITPEQAQLISKEDLPGIEFIEEIKRFYPGNTLLCHVLGFVNIDNKGLEGLEYHFNDYLEGHSGQRITERDAAGREIVLQRKKDLPPRDGYHLILTIDTTIQEIVETELDAVVKEFNALSGTVIVMNPNNGEILAMANYPVFDLNYAGKSPESFRRNRAVTDIFEPGSTFKPFVLGIALNEKLVNLSDRFFCEKGSYRIGRHVLHDAHKFDILTAQEIIELSSNIGIAKIALKIGPEVLYDYLKRFPFGKKTLVDLPGEASGIMHPINKWSKYSIYSIPMGHEISVTVLQLATTFSVLANGGRLFKPIIIKEILDQEGSVIYKTDPNVVDEIFPESVTEKLKNALEGVVSPDGTAEKAYVPGYSVAGKTGTAQKIEPEGGYSKTKFISSFIGFLPSRRPEVLIAVIINEPLEKHYGGTVAAPAFQKIAYQIMRYMEIPPDDVVERNEL